MVLMRVGLPSIWLVVATGVVVGVVAGILTRRAGDKDSPGRRAAAVGTGAYVFILWFAALVPVHGSVAGQCVTAQVHPFRILEEIAHGPRNPLASPAVLEALANIVFFTPLGLAVKAAGRRFSHAVLLGFLTSLLIEVSQLTGLFFVVRCSYRVFDVDDLWLNTTGAALGWLIGATIQGITWIRLRLRRLDDVSISQRLGGMAADVAASLLLGVAATITWRAFSFYVLGWQLAPHVDLVDRIWVWLFPAVVQGAWIALRARTIGEDLVHLRPMERADHPDRGLRIKFACGVGGFLVVAALPIGWWPVLAYAVVSVVGVLVTKHHRGISHALAGMDLETSDPLPTPAPARCDSES